MLYVRMIWGGSATAPATVPRCRGYVLFRCDVTPCCVSVRAAGKDVGPVPAMPKLKWLQLIQSVTIVMVTMMVVVVTSGVVGGRWKVTGEDDADDVTRGVIVTMVMREVIAVDG